MVQTAYDVRVYATRWKPFLAAMSLAGVVVVAFLVYFCDTPNPQLASVAVSATSCNHDLRRRATSLWHLSAAWLVLDVHVTAGLHRTSPSLECMWRSSFMRYTS